MQARDKWVHFVMSQEELERMQQPQRTPVVHEALNADIGDIMEFLPDESDDNEC